MAYSFMTIQKVKNMGTLKSKYNHNCRKVEVSNVIPEFINDNDTLVALPKSNGMERDYAEAVADRINELDYYKTHKMRPDQVLAYEVVLTFSRTADIDVDEWEARSVQWLKDTFDVAPDGKSNVLHAICHKDEPGNVHIHAIVTPVDETGRFNAKTFTNGYKAMVDLQTSYAEAVEDLGLERGVIGTSARHRDIRKLYAELNNAIDKVPEVLEGETADEYRLRTFEYIQEQLATSIREKNEYDAKLRAKRDIDFRQSGDTLDEMLYNFQEKEQEHKSIISSYKKEIEEQEKQIDKNESIIDSYEEQIQELRLQLAMMRKMVSEDVVKKAEKTDALETGIELLSQENEERANYIREQVEYLEGKGREFIETISQQNEINIDENDIDTIGS